MNQVYSPATYAARESIKKEWLVVNSLVPFACNASSSAENLGESENSVDDAGGWLCLISVLAEVVLSGRSKRW